MKGTAQSWINTYVQLPGIESNAGFKVKNVIWAKKIVGSNHITLSFL